MLSALHNQVEQQRIEVLNNFQTNPRPSGKSYTAKMTQQQKRDWLAGLIAWLYFTNAMSGVLKPILYGLLVETGMDAISQVGKQPSQFDPTVVAITKYMTDRSNKIAGDVNAETEKQLRASLGQGLDNSESNDQIRARIEEVFGAALTYRSDRITTTETTRAQGFADITAWKQAGNVTGKEWTVQSGNPCPFCQSLDGTIVSLDSNYYSLGDVVDAGGKTMTVSYDDVGSPPIHPNCQCILTPITVS